MNMKKIKDIAKVSAGQSAPKAIGYNIDGYPFIRAGSLEGLLDGESIANLEKVSEEVAKKHKLKLYWPETVVFAKSGMSATKNRIYMLEDLSYVVSHLAILEPFNVEPKYLVYALRHFSPKQLIQDMAYPSISLKSIENHSIFVPEKEDDQIHIVKLLSQVESLIAKRKESIRLLDELVRNKFLEMFGDPVSNPYNLEVVNLGSFGNWQSGGTPSRSKKEYFGGDIPWVTSGELNDLYIYNSNEKITQEAINNSNTKLIEEGSLLLGMYDTAALKSSITKGVIACNQAIAFSKLDDSRCNTLFVYHLIQIGKAYFKKQQRGVRQKNMNLSMIKDLKVLNPDINLQNDFASIVKKVEEIKTIYHDSLINMENLFASLSHKAFNEQLDLSGLSIDHIIPKSIGGSNNVENLQVLTTEDNIKKFDKMPDDWNRLKLQEFEKKKSFIESTSIPQKAKKSNQIITAALLAEWIKEEFKDKHFTSEMLIRFCKKERKLTPHYFTSQELKENRKVDLSQDVKEIIFQFIKGENDYLQLEQLFYDGEKENFVLEVRSQDYDLIQNKTPKERSGIYLRLKS